MRGSISVKVSVVMLSVGLTGVALYATSQQAFKAPVTVPKNWTQLESGIIAVAPEDLSAIAAKSNGAVVVGTGGVKVHFKTDDTYTVDATGTNTDLIAAHFRYPFLLISGFDYVGLNKFDGSGWQDLVDTSDSGNIYSPVFSTSSRAFFGWPDLSLVGFSYVCFETYGSTPGMCRMVSSPVMGLAEFPAGIRGVTKFGDIFEWPLDLTDETTIYDQSDDQQLDLVRAYFSENLGSGVQAINRLGPGSFDYRWHPGTSEGSWTVKSIPFTMDVLGLANDPGHWPFQNFTIVGSDGGSHARIYGTQDGGSNWQREAEDVDASADHPLIDIAIVPCAGGGAPKRMAVGNSGTVLVSSMNSTVFDDGFESGSYGEWSDIRF